MRKNVARRNMSGRLGNQMFQYAATRGILARMGCGDTEFEFNFSKFIYSRNFQDELEDLKVKKYKEVKRIRVGIIQGILILYCRLREYLIEKADKENSEEKVFVFQSKMAPILSRFGVYRMTMGYYDFGELGKNVKNKVFMGKFESARYFDNIREEILEEFEPKEPRLGKNLPLYEEIEKNESVCVTIRRGDYLSKRFKNDFYVCDPDYFNRAIELMKGKVKNPKFFVFSDDVEWCKKNMNFPKGTVFEDGNDPVWEKLRLMKTCKHFIISNSTFSWWAQYLSRNEGKIVIAPARWRNDGALWKDIYQDNWTTIDVK